MTARWIEDEDGGGAFVEVPFTRKRKMNETQELLPCPFCGRRAHHGLGKVSYCQLHGDPFQNYRVWCPDNCAEKSAGDKERAFALWNRRAPLPDYERLLEAAENAMYTLERGEFLLERQSFYYGRGGAEPSPAEWGVAAGYQETADKSPFDQFVDEVTRFHSENLEESEDPRFLTLANNLRSAIQAIREKKG